MKMEKPISKTYQFPVSKTYHIPVKGISQSNAEGLVSKHSSYCHRTERSKDEVKEF